MSFQRGWDCIAAGWGTDLRELKEPYYQKLTVKQTRTEFGRVRPSILINYHHLNGEPMLRANKSQLGRARLHGDPDRKYTGRFGDPVALYFPAGLQKLLKKAKRIRFVEGEHKADSLVRRGLAAVGFQGISGWQARGIPALGFDEIAPHLKGRPVEIPMDSDVPFNPESRAWVKRLGMHLLTYEPKRVLLKALPVLDINAANLRKSKTGVDDFLHHKSLADFLALPSVDITEPQFKDWYVSTEDVLPEPDPDWRKKPRVKSGPVCAPYWYERQITAVNAEGGTGKTFLQMEAAVCIATGSPFFGVGDTVPQKRVVAYAMLERDEDDFFDRLKRVITEVRNRIRKEQRGQFDRDIDANLVPIHRRAVYLIEYRDHQWKPVDQKLQATAAWMQRQRVDVLFIEPLARMHGANESDNAVSAAVINFWEGVIAAAKICVGYSHHTGQDTNSNAKYSGRGASGWSDNVSNVVVMREVKASESVELDMTAPIAEGSVLVRVDCPRRSAVSSAVDPLFLARDPFTGVLRRAPIKLKRGGELLLQHAEVMSKLPSFSTFSLSKRLEITRSGAERVIAAALEANKIHKLHGSAQGGGSRFAWNKPPGA
jgi:hypothetical protein